MLVLIIINVENYFCANGDIFYMIIYLFELDYNFTCTFDSFNVSLLNTNI